MIKSTNIPLEIIFTTPNGVYCIAKKQGIDNLYMVISNNRMANGLFAFNEYQSEIELECRTVEECKEHIFNKLEHKYIFTLKEWSKKEEFWDKIRDFFDDVREEM